jgi:hypothetical protein
MLLLLLVPSLSFAGQKPCPCKDAHKAHRHAAVKVEAQAKPTAKEASYDALGALVDGFSVTGGFRWDRACPDPLALEPAVQHNDPFFVGVEERIPLASWVDLGGNFDRDFTEAAHWNARVFVAAHPWRK